MPLWSSQSKKLPRQSEILHDSFFLLPEFISIVRPFPPAYARHSLFVISIPIALFTRFIIA